MPPSPSLVSSVVVALALSTAMRTDVAVTLVGPNIHIHGRLTGNWILVKRETLNNSIVDAKDFGE